MQEYFASCLANLEPLLDRELRGLGAKQCRPLMGGVAFHAEPESMYRICLWSRLASRISLVMERVDATDSDRLYEGAKALPWESIIGVGKTFIVHAHGTNDNLRNSHFTELRVKDAICDRLLAKRGKRPDVSTDNPDVMIDVRIRWEQATISLDMTGGSLYLRSYLNPKSAFKQSHEVAMAAGVLFDREWCAKKKPRKPRWSKDDQAVAEAVEAADVQAAEDAQAAAEALAAAEAVAVQDVREDVQAANVQDVQEASAVAPVAPEAQEPQDASVPQQPVCLIDPSCGQGHLLVEAAMMVADVAPSLARSNWGFYGWAGHDDELWASILDEADARYEAGMEAAAKNGMRMMGVAQYTSAIDLAKDHAKRAGVADLLNFQLVESQNMGAFFARLQQHLDKANMKVRVMSLVSSQVEMLQGDSLDLAIACEACRIIKAGDYCLIGGEAAVIRFGVDPVHRMELGSGRVACDVVTFDKPPVELVKVTIPDSFGGADHVVSLRDAGAVQFADRLRKVAKERRKWAAAEGIRCYRVYDADLPEYAAAIDVYEGAGAAEGQVYLHIAEYEAPATIETAKAVRRFDDLVALAPIVMGIDPKHVFTKVRRRDKGGSQYSRDKANFVTYTAEGDHVVEVDLNGYLDTGIFLDHRTTRCMVGEMARGTRFLNLFAYTGTATLHAAAGGAAETTTVDLSQTYLEWAQRNMGMNGFDGPQHMYERGDVMRWIDQARKARRKFDLIFVDPPTFSNSKSMGKSTWDVQRDHVELLIGVSRLLAKGGVAVFSCNLRTFKPDYEKLAEFGVELTDITEKTIPHDFERNPKIHKCYLVKRVLAPKTNVIEIPVEAEEDTAEEQALVEGAGNQTVAGADAVAGGEAIDGNRDFKARDDRDGFKPRREGDRKGFKSHRDGDRKGGDFKRRDGGRGGRDGYKKDGDRGGFRKDGDRRDFKPRRDRKFDDGDRREFKPRGDRRFGDDDRKGGRDFKRDGSRDGYKRNDRDGQRGESYKGGNRDGFKRGEGGFKKDGARKDFKPRGNGGGFKPRGNGGSNGDFKRSDSGQRSHGGKGHRGQPGFKSRG